MLNISIMVLIAISTLFITWDTVKDSILSQNGSNNIPNIPVMPGKEVDIEYADYDIIQTIEPNKGCVSLHDDLEANVEYESTTIQNEIDYSSEDQIDISDYLKPNVERKISVDQNGINDLEANVEYESTTIQNEIDYSSEDQIDISDYLKPNVERKISVDQNGINDLEANVEYESTTLQNEIDYSSEDQIDISDYLKPNVEREMSVFQFEVCDLDKDLSSLKNNMHSLFQEIISISNGQSSDDKQILTEWIFKNILLNNEYHCQVIKAIKEIGAKDLIDALWKLNENLRQEIALSNTKFCGYKVQIVDDVLVISKPKIVDNIPTITEPKIIIALEDGLLFERTDTIEKIKLIPDFDDMSIGDIELLINYLTLLYSNINNISIATSNYHDLREVICSTPNISGAQSVTISNKGVVMDLCFSMPFNEQRNKLRLCVSDEITIHENTVNLLKKINCFGSIQLDLHNIKIVDRDRFNSMLLVFIEKTFPNMNVIQILSLTNIENKNLSSMIVEIKERGVIIFKNNILNENHAPIIKEALGKRDNKSIYIYVGERCVFPEDNINTLPNSRAGSSNRTSSENKNPTTQETCLVSDEVNRMIESAKAIDFQAVFDISKTNYKNTLLLISGAAECEQTVIKEAAAQCIVNEFMYGENTYVYDIIKAIRMHDDNEMTLALNELNEYMIKEVSNMGIELNDFVISKTDLKNGAIIIKQSANLEEKGIPMLGVDTFKIRDVYIVIGNDCINDRKLKALLKYIILLYNNLNRLHIIGDQPYYPMFMNCLYGIPGLDLVNFNDTNIIATFDFSTNFTKQINQLKLGFYTQKCVFEGIENILERQKTTIGVIDLNITDIEYVDLFNKALSVFIKKIFKKVNVIKISSLANIDEENLGSMIIEMKENGGIIFEENILNVNHATIMREALVERGNKSIFIYVGDICVFPKSKLYKSSESGLGSTESFESGSTEHENESPTPGKENLVLDKIDPTIESELKAIIQLADVMDIQDTLDISKTSYRSIFLLINEAGICENGDVKGVVASWIVSELLYGEISYFYSIIQVIKQHDDSNEMTLALRKLNEYIVKEVANRGLELNDFAIIEVDLDNSAISIVQNKIPYSEQEYKLETTNLIIPTKVRIVFDSNALKYKDSELQVLFRYVVLCFGPKEVQVKMVDTKEYNETIMNSLSDVLGCSPSDSTYSEDGMLFTF